MDQSKRQIDALVAFVRAKPVVDVEDIVVIFVVVAVVVRGFARLCQHAAGVERRFVLELWVAYAIRVHDVRCELAKRLRNDQCHAKARFGMSFLQIGECPMRQPDGYQFGFVPVA